MLAANHAPERDNSRSANQEIDPMLNNSAMKAGRFAAWARYRAAERRIVNSLKAGRAVYLTGSAWTITKLTKRNVDGVKAIKNGLFVHGKRWVCYMDGVVSCGIVIR